MTVMPEHGACLPVSAQLLVLDPAIGPVLRPVAVLALGDEVLAVAGGRMGFRRVLAVQDEAAPAHIVVIPAEALGPQTPHTDLALDARQPVGAAVAHAPRQPAESHVASSGGADIAGWMLVQAEGADFLIVDHLAIGTGPLPESAAKGATPPAEPPAPTPIQGPAPLRAFNGKVELPLLEAMWEGGTIVLRYTLPPRTTTLRLTSASAQAAGDIRRLGVAILRLVTETSEIPLGSPALVRGFHATESGEGHSWRWTDGDALMILPPRPLPQTLSIHITDWHRLLAPQP
jgi:hypothetical protein